MKTIHLLILALTLTLVGCETTSNEQKPSSAEQKPADSKSEQKPELGMTKEQVIARYGKTDNIQQSNTGETWVYNLNMGEAFIPFNFGYRPKTRIINFDQEGKVASWSYTK